MEHIFEKDGYTLKGSERHGIKLLSNKNDCYVKVFCDEDDMDDIQAQIQRHVDGVETTTPVVDGSEEFFVVDTDSEEYFYSWKDALLYKVDPEGVLSSLYNGGYVITLSSKPDDTAQNSNTDLTQHRVNSMEGVIEGIYHQPYIHRLHGFTEQEKEDLYQLSLRIQKLKDIEPETREVVL